MLQIDKLTVVTIEHHTMPIDCLKYNSLD